MTSSNDRWKGALLVALGATSYGTLATFVKLAYHDSGMTGKPFAPGEVTGSQFLLGIIGVWILNRLSKKERNHPVRPSKNQKLQLMLVGSSTGLTSVFYYLSVQFIPVSIAIVLLMQTVWMAVLWEALMEKKSPSGQKILAVLLVLGGTALASGVIGSDVSLDWRGIALGLVAAASFTATMYGANRIATEISSGRRSLFMLFGGGIVALIFCCVTLQWPINWNILWSWGIWLALFGTILPPYLLNQGFPKTGMGLGSIVSALELPVSVTMAWIVLAEVVSGLQWIGIGIILGAVILMNFSGLKLRK